MTLPSPLPRPGAIAAKRFAPNVIRKHYLTPPSVRVEADLFSTLDARRSYRDLGAISESQIADVLWYAARLLNRTSPRDDHEERKCPFPSAGGLQSQNILVQHPHSALQFYDPIAHALCDFGAPPLAVSQLSIEARKVVDAPDAAILWIAGDHALINAYYSEGESLLWRDAGILLFAISIVAEALRLGACILGLSGEPLISKLFGEHLTGFGAVVLGKRIPQIRPDGLVRYTESVD